MSDTVLIALIAVLGTVFTAIAGIIVAWLNNRPKQERSAPDRSSFRPDARRQRTGSWKGRKSGSETH